MERIQTLIQHLHPTAIIRQHSMLLRGCYSGLLRAGAPPAIVTRSEATVERWMDDSGIEEERAGGGPGPTVGGPEQEDRGRIRADVYPEYCQSITYRMTAETLRVRADIACVTYTCTCTVTTVRKWDYFFLDQSDFKDAVESQIRKGNERISNLCCCIQL
jgi:hypothetical protein